MISKKITAYLDSRLTKRLESLTLNLIPSQTHSSDFSILYIAETDVKDDDGYPTHTRITSGDSIFVSVIDESGFINFENIKLLHVPGVFETDFETIEYYPSNENMHLFSTYYEGREVSSLGGWMDFAFCPFGINTIEFLDGSTMDIYGRGRIWIEKHQRGLKGYKSIQKIPEILSFSYYKVLKLAIYSKFSWNISNTFSLNLFSPSMQIKQERIDNMLKLSNNKITAYITSKNGTFGEDGFVVNQKDNQLLPCKNISVGEKSEYYGIGEKINISKVGYIDATKIKDSISDEFTIHLNCVVSEYAPRGTMLFEIGYAKGSTGLPTRFVTLWLNSDGFICYNTSFMNEATNTEIKFQKDIESSITFTVSSEKYSEEDAEEFTTFIHFNGKQIWPKETMPYEYQREYLWKGMTAWKTYQEVCMKMKSPPPTPGVLDPKLICVQKLLHESGFMDIEDLHKIFDLYDGRPRACASDFGRIKFNTEYIDDTDSSKNYNSKIETFAIGQDAYLDTSDSSYYSEIEISDIMICGERLTRKQIELVHELNTVKLAAITNDITTTN